MADITVEVGVVEVAGLLPVPSYKISGPDIGHPGVVPLWVRRFMLPRHDRQAHLMVSLALDTDHRLRLHFRRACSRDVCHFPSLFLLPAVGSRQFAGSRIQ